MGIKISELNSADQVQNNDILPIVQNDETKKVTKEILLGDISQYLRNVYTKTQTDTLLNEKANQDDLDETNTFVTNLRNRMTTAEGNIMDLQTDSVATLELSMNATTYVLTANLKNKAGVIVSTSTVDLPLESLVKDIQYDSTTKEIVFILQDGTERRIPLNDLISGLVNQEDFEASQEEQDTRITDLEKEVEILSETIDSELEDGTATGESITVNDSARAKAKLDVGGNTKQNQYEGYNVLPIPDIAETTQNGITYSAKDGEIKLNGTATSNVPIVLMRDLEFTTTDKMTVVRNSNNPNDVQPRITVTIDGTEYNVQNQGSHLDYRTFDAGTITLVRIYITSGTVLNNVTIKPMIYLGEYDVNKTYEPYVGGQASPNPEYPKDVHVLKGSNTIKVESKNILEYTTWTLGQYLDSNNEIQTLGSWCFSDYIPIDKSFIYISHSAGNAPKNILYDSQKNMIGYFNVKGSSSVPNTTLLSEYPNAKYIRVSLTQSSISKNKLYKGQIYPLTLPEGMEMCKTEGNRDGFVKDLDSGKWYKNKKQAKYIFDGTESWTIATKGFFFLNNPSFPNSGTGSHIVPSYCSHFIAKSFNIIYNGGVNGFAFSYAENQHRLCIRDVDFQNVDDFKNWLAEQYQNGNPVIVYCPLVEPVLEEITDTTLIRELDELYETLRTYYGQTNITVESEDLPPMMTLNYKKSNRALRSEIDTIKARLDLLEN